MLHTPWFQDKSFWLAAVLPLAFLGLLVAGVKLDVSTIGAVSALPMTFITLSKGKQAYVLGKAPGSPVPAVTAASPEVKK